MEVQFLQYVILTNFGAKIQISCCNRFGWSTSMFLTFEGCLCPDFLSRTFTYLIGFAAGKVMAKLATGVPQVNRVVHQLVHSSGKICMRHFFTDSTSHRVKLRLSSSCP